MACSSAHSMLVLEDQKTVQLLVKVVEVACTRIFLQNILCVPLPRPLGLPTGSIIGKGRQSCVHTRFLEIARSGS